MVWAGSPWDVVALVVFSVVVLGCTVVVARRDVIAAGFVAFFFVYTIFAMIGYRLLPIISWVERLYFGPEVYVPYYVFVLASFLGLTVVLLILERHFVAGAHFEVVYAPSDTAKVAGYGLIAALALAMAWTLSRIIGDISYGGNPQIPNKGFAIAFKYLPVLILIMYAMARDFGTSAAERGLAGVLGGVLTATFLLTGMRAGNRTDILSLLLGLVTYELYPFFVTEGGGLARRPCPGALRRVLLVVAVLAVGGLLMQHVFATRAADELRTGLPWYASVLMNDYYSPAHMLFAAIRLDYVDPLLVLKSNIANSLFLGGRLGIPYLQEELGNLIVPGSASRSTGYGYFIFTEGFMAMKWMGILYNSVVPATGIILWRRLGTSTDQRYNALVAGLCSMFFAVVARSGNHILIRNYLTVLVPAILLFRALAGARPVAQQAVGQVVGETA